MPGTFACIILRMSKKSKNRKQRIASQGKKKERAGYVRVVGEGLRNLMGDIKFYREEELTRAVMLDFLKFQGEIEEVKGLVEVTVQTMVGASVVVMLEERDGINSNVRALKSEIEEVEGTSRYRQELFMLVEGVEDGSGEPLSDGFKIESACTVALCVKPEAEWEWDAASELMKDKVFELSGPNNSIATRIDQDGNYDNCMMVGRVIEAGTGRHTISMKLAKGSTNLNRPLVVAVRRRGYLIHLRCVLEKRTTQYRKQRITEHSIQVAEN